LAAADSSLGQIPHNHFCVVDAIRLDGTEGQKKFYFEQVLSGKRFGNAFSEVGTKNVMDFRTRITPDGNAFRVNGKKFYSTGALFAHIIPTAARRRQRIREPVLLKNIRVLLTESRRNKPSRHEQQT
jgi:alkylation response protein AidB-like acyl-CoA dehydrogenase